MIWFFWEGGISDTRLRIMKDCINSTRFFNPDREITLVSNSLTSEMFSDIKVQKWNADLFEDTPISPDLIRKYYLSAHYRDQSDIVRMALLYKFGGSYIDTDDLCIKKMSDLPNLVCRSYDPHTSFYNKITPDQCISGKYREFRGYDDINMFPRNDCWQNFEPRNEFIRDLLSDSKIQNSTKPIGICDDFSWQSLTLEYLQKHLPLGNVNYGLTLAYLFEGHVSCCSHYDMGCFRGEMVDIWKAFPEVGAYEWGKYKTDKNTALEFLETIRNRYPFLSHLWLHDKDMNPEWLQKLGAERYAVSTWIINEIRSLYE